MLTGISKPERFYVLVKIPNIFDVVTESRGVLRKGGGVNREITLPYTPPR